MNKKTIIITAIVIVVLFILLEIYLNVNYNLKIYIMNAGKADCSVITYNDKTIVIDTGEEDFYETLDSFLRTNSITKVDYLIITHFDKDHVGSASKLIDNYDIGTIYQTNKPKNSEFYDNYIRSIRDKNIDPITVSNDLDVSMEDLKIIINGPTKVYNVDEHNNSSLITSIKYKNRSYLFMGDAMNERMSDYLNSHDDKYNIIKLPHHGDYMKGDKDLIDKFKPSGVVVSSNFMDDRLKDLIKDKKLKLYYTNDSNYILFKER